MHRYSSLLVATILVASLVLSLVGCSPQTAAPAPTSTSAAAAQPTQANQPTQAAQAQPTQAAQPTSAPAASDNKADLGQFAEPAPLANPDANYPNKPITNIIGYAPGGGSDVLAQAVQPYVEKELGVSIVNQYRPGASGAIGWTEVANSKADGYLITIITTPTLHGNIITNPKEIKYRLSDLIPLYNVVTDPGILVVKADSPYQTFQDLVDAAKANPKMVTIGNSGVWGDDYVSTLKIEKATGIEVAKVPFAGDGPSWQAALGGHVSASSNNLGIVYPQVEAGALRALAVYSDERSSYLPDVPTLIELGIDVTSGSARGYAVPNGTPKPYFDKLVAAFEKATQNPEFLANAEKNALPLDVMGPEEYVKYLQEEADVTAELYKEVQQ